jgi:hypothetical protein
MKAAGLLFLAMAVSLSPAAAVRHSDPDVTSTASCDHRGLRPQEGGDWLTGTAGRGAVHASSGQSAIRLASPPTDGLSVRTDVFAPVKGSHTMPVLSPPVMTSRAGRGVYLGSIEAHTSGVNLGN